MPIAEIAREQDIPTRFLEAILRQLKQAGLTDSARGKDGGYFLAKPARATKVGDVIRIIEGPLVGTNPPSAPEQDILNDVWQRAEKALADVYDGEDFAALAERDRIQKQGGIANYAI